MLVTESSLKKKGRNPPPKHTHTQKSSLMKPAHALTEVVCAPTRALFLFTLPRTGNVDSSLKITISGKRVILLDLAWKFCTEIMFDDFVIVC